MTNEVLTRTERNALAWVQFIEYYDRTIERQISDQETLALLKWRVAIQRTTVREEQ